MGTPAEDVSKNWRNNVDEVLRFLEYFHEGNYMVFNLTEKLDYSVEKFGKVVHMGWLDNHAPSLNLLLSLIDEMDRWLSADEDNIVAVHCKAGRGRTGTVIASYFLLKEQYERYEDALNYFAYTRSSTREGINVPCQKRYVQYVQLVLNGLVPRDLVSSPQPIKLTKILMRPVPSVDLIRRGFSPFIEFYKLSLNVEPDLIYSYDPNARFQSTVDVVVDLNLSLLLSGDILIRFYQNNKVWSMGKRIMICRLQFHTLFVRDGFIDFSASSIDGPNNTSLAGVANFSSSFGKDFEIRLMFD